MRLYLCTIVILGPLAYHRDAYYMLSLVDLFASYVQPPRLLLTVLMYMNILTEGGMGLSRDAGHPSGRYVGINR